MLFENEIKLFPASIEEVLQRIDRLDPVKYSSTRNYINGSVSYLSPYISRGVISTRFVVSRLIKKGYQPARIEKFIQELAWRDYWQQVWIAKGDAINSDLKNEQIPIANYDIPKAVINATSGIEAIDKAIRNFYKSGYLHNHVRMYIASLVCNIAQCHWMVPAKWMYYYLLDADWASNALSWQWVAGANSHKKYYANQVNINKYCFTKQKNTYLDVSYESFAGMGIPNALIEAVTLSFNTPLPKNNDISIDHDLPTCLYNFYNLDPLWRKDESVNRILLLEPSHFKKYPVSAKSLDFMLNLSKNLNNIQIYVGEFQEFLKAFNLKNIYFKEHPLNNHYQGVEEPRDWMFTTQGYYPSFFSYWKKCQKELYRYETSL